VLAGIEGEYGGIDSDAGERLVDYAARESARLRVARHGGKEDVKVPAALRCPRWRSEEEDEEQYGERTLHRTLSFTIPSVPAQAGIRDVPTRSNAYYREARIIGPRLGFFGEKDLATAPPN
jgi:hypothetical protein